MKKLLITIIVATGLVMGAVPLAAPAGASTDPARLEIEFLQLLNMQRATAGLPLLPLDTAASSVARNWSTRMNAESRLYHNPNLAADITTWVTPHWLRIGENVGVGGSVPRLHRAFWDSPGHRANIVGDYNRVGIGVSVTSSGRIWVTFNFVKGPAISGTLGLAGCQSPSWVLDGWGGLHAVGGAAKVTAGTYWPGFDIARDVDLNAEGRGFVLDGWGGLHATKGTAKVYSSGWWPGWDIARGVTTTADAKGAYVVDGWGGVHPAGTARKVRVTTYWPGWDIARDIALQPGSNDRGYVLDAWGGLHPFGNMPAAKMSFYQAGEHAKSLVFNDDGKGGYVVDKLGRLHPFTVGNAPMPAALAVGLHSARTVRGAVVDSGKVTVVTDNGAHVGYRPCASGAAWGHWDIVRSIDSP